jgi:hypothetical protein
MVMRTLAMRKRRRARLDKETTVNERVDSAATLASPRKVTRISSQTLDSIWRSPSTVGERAESG